MTDSQVPSQEIPVAPAAPVPPENRSYFRRIFSGRINRMSYFFGPFIISIIISLIYSVIVGLFLASTLIKLSELPQFSMFLSFFTLIPSFLYGLSLSVRRTHDIGKKWTFLLLGLIPLINIYVSLVLLLKAGDRQENRYGPVPESGIRMGELIGWA